jgi:hypothetical protein
MATMKVNNGMRSKRCGKRKSSIGLCILSVVFLSSVVLANEVGSYDGESQTTLSFAKNELDKWVETKTLISSEKRSWSEEKAFSEHLLGALSEEKAGLNENVDAIKSALSGGDEKRMALLAELEKFQTTQAELGNKIDSIAKQLLLIRERLPQAFKEDLAKDYDRLTMYSGEDTPTQGKVESAVVLAMKLQNLDNSFSSRTQVIDVEVDGERLEREVEILYMGLWRAYYVDPYDRFAGVGFASAQGWVWLEDSSIVGDVKQALNIFEGEITPALITLPVIAGALN